MASGGKRKGAGRKEGSISQKKIMWNQMGEWFANEGAERALQHIMELEEPKEYLRAYMDMLEYFKPKMSRQEVKHELDEQITEVKVTIKK